MGKYVEGYTMLGHTPKPVTVLLSEDGGIESVCMNDRAMGGNAIRAVERWFAVTDWRLAPLGIAPLKGPEAPALYITTPQDVVAAIEFDNNINGAP